MSLEPFTSFVVRKYVRLLEDPESTQRRLLAHFLKSFAGGPVASALGLIGTESLEEFLHLAPRDYSFYEPFALRALEGDRTVFGSSPLVALGETSGSMGRSKLIPHTRESLDQYTRLTKLILLFHLWQGQTYLPRFTRWLLVTACCEVREEHGVPIGFVSGLVYRRSKEKRKGFIFPSLEVAQITDWDERVRRTATEALPKRIGALFGVPAYIVSLLREASAQVRGRPLGSVWPYLNKVYYSGTSLGAHLAEMEALIGARLMSRSIYMSTEAVLAAELDPDAQGQMRLLSDFTVMTFRPENEPDSSLVPLWDLMPGKRYEVFITTASGLCQYQIGDLVEVTNTDPLLIRLAGRAGDEINLATEKLSCKQAESVLCKVSEQSPVSSDSFTVLPDPNDSSRHLWLLQRLVESGRAPNEEEIAHLIDHELSAINPSYAALRAGDAVLKLPRVILLPEGAFDLYIKSGLSSHGQFKFRHIFPSAGRLLARPGMERIEPYLK